MTEITARPISASTRCCAVLGHPVEHSALPAMHRAGIAALALDWRCVAFDVPPGQLKPAIEGAKALRFVGLNLTLPHRLLAAGLPDALDESARAWGAVDTLRFEARAAGGEWRPIAAFGDEVPDEVRALGFNTDASGLLQALRENVQFEPLGSRIVANGLGMLLYQGAQALELWSGRPAPVEVMRRALRESVYGA